jgi:phage terminase large subunit
MLQPRRTLKRDIARVFVPLKQPARYKGAYGGRGSGKSHEMASDLVEDCVQFPGLHAVCIREVQKSLSQSAKRLIEIKARELGVGSLFDPRKTEITTPGGGLIIFQGMQNHTADSIKSLEGYDRAWVEEAQSLSARSLRLLRPTLRKPGSELWFSWNPQDPKDPVDELLRGAEKPPGAVVVNANWNHNPWFYETTLPEERLFDYRRDRDMYAHVWDGAYEKNSEARVFKNWRVDWFDVSTFRDVRILGGADWGFSVDPSVLVLCFVVGRTLYIWREVWKVGCDIDRLPTLFDGVDPDYAAKRADLEWKSIARKVPITADSARPETISYMQKHGFPRMQAAIKGAGSVEDGIEFLKSYDIVIHPDCRHVAAEFEHYSYLVDPKTDEVTSVLSDKKNHTIDSVRYSTEAIRRAHSFTSKSFG